MPVFFVHDVGHGIVTPLDRKFRVREINPAQEVSAARKVHQKQETDTEDFKHHYPKQNKKDEQTKESTTDVNRKAIQAYQEQTPVPKLTLGRVKDIMSQPVISIFQDQSLSAAWTLMQQHAISHLVILNEQYQYCGLLSEKLLAPYLMKMISHLVNLDSPENIGLEVFCRQNLLSTHPDTELSDLGPAMLEYNLDAVAVNENGKITGIVSKSDVFKVIIKHQNFEALA